MTVNIPVIEMPSGPWEVEIRCVPSYEVLRAKLKTATAIYDTPDGEQIGTANAGRIVDVREQRGPWWLVWKDAKGEWWIKP